ncbi:MAG: transglutaminase domain-containing protein [Lachnospiraceae bacterium]|nr:transglutaminase domain-containing protein [Lachnospiraceae bacterium]
MSVFSETIRQEISDSFERRCSAFPELCTVIRLKIAAQEDEDLRTALMYLYGSMPLSDMVTYPLDTFLDFARRGVSLRRTRADVQALPEEIYLQYVLFHRVNEEEILPCRELFGKALDERLSGERGEQAAIDIGYWCAEQGTYHSTDIRTIAALNFYKRGFGRCGEESAFAVNALRAYGIPARQVYVPRWAHCEDNHAWVELYVDGRWHYTGGCEPMEVLDRGWFTNAASRAMMIHSRFFGDVAMPEKGEVPTCSGSMACANESADTVNKNKEGNPTGKECAAQHVVTEKNACADDDHMKKEPGGDVQQRAGREYYVGREGVVTVLDQLPRYAKTVYLSVRVLQEDGSPAPHAAVHLQLLNEAQYVSIADLETDDGGNCGCVTGYGSVRVVAEKKVPAPVSGSVPSTVSVFLVVNTNETNHVEIRFHGDADSFFDMTEEMQRIGANVQPQGREVTAGIEEIGSVSMTAYKRDWFTSDFEAPAPSVSFVFASVPSAVQMRRGKERLAEANAARKASRDSYVNQDLTAFLKKCEQGRDAQLRRALVDSLTEKDRADVTLDVLEDALTGAMPYYPWTLKDTFSVNAEGAHGTSSQETSDEDKRERDIFIKDVLCPRVANEILRPCRAEFMKMLSAQQKDAFRENPKALWTWLCGHVRACPQLERTSVVTPPAACLASGTGSSLSKEILCVALLRALGVPARRRELDGRIEYYRDHRFVPLLPENARTALVHFTKAQGSVLTYSKDWTLCRCGDAKEGALCDGTSARHVWTHRNGGPACSEWRNKAEDCESEETLHLEDTAWTGDELNVSLVPGVYRVTTENRLPNGNILAADRYFRAERGLAADVNIELRKAKLSEMLAHISLPECTFAQAASSAGGQTQSRLSTLSEGSKKIFIWLEEGAEPTEHILNELYEKRKAFTPLARNGQVFFIVRSDKSLCDTLVQRAIDALPGITVLLDDFTDNVENTARGMYVDPGSLPLILVTDGTLNGIYASSGYNVGTGDMLLRICGAE